MQNSSTLSTASSRAASVTVGEIACAGKGDTLLPEVAGLEALWRRYVHGDAAPDARPMAERVLLDMLGLGNVQTIRQLLDERPSFADFRAWIVATAGAPDPVRLARYHHWYRGDPLPPEAAAMLAAIDAALPVLSAENLAQWDEQGFVILRAAIDADAAAAVAGLVWDAVGGSPDDPASWGDDALEGIMIPRFQHPLLEVARRSPRVHEAFAQLWGTADLWTTIDRLGFNPPLATGRPFRGSPLHWDVSLATPIPFSTQGVLYLTDTTADQGAFQLVPGFHHRIEQWLHDLGDADPRAIDLSAQAVRVPGKAGDLIIWRQDLPHGASPNRSARPRLVQYLTMYSPDQEVQPIWR
ncbi:phytanoyl-CoA dioxygenase family protein [Sphingomonas sp. GlSt437]|uniref:phytanoyl-CoA dioxygenase family protein n=1 Tax=Sphingomonas sp. GlSt437 TaxID=3389970 RepID=UPI003EC00161